ncbi:MAG: hypothetical protein ACPG1A_03810 [Halioglobus sp.]
MTANRLVTLSLGLVLAAPLAADEFTDVAMGLCEKVKSCAMKQIATEELTPEVRQMMEPMLENMCANMQANIGEVPTGHELYEPALSCMRSMEQLSCERMQDPDSMRTPECDKYQDLVKKHGGES